MSRITTNVAYEFGRGWVATIRVTNDIGGYTEAEHDCATRWGARRYARRWKRKLQRIDRQGDLR